jgi:hypothetical protein
MSLLSFLPSYEDPPPVPITQVTTWSGIQQLSGQDHYPPPPTELFTQKSEENRREIANSRPVTSGLSGCHPASASIISLYSFPSYW